MLTFILLKAWGNTCPTGLTASGIAFILEDYTTLGSVRVSLWRWHRWNYVNKYWDGVRIRYRLSAHGAIYLKRHQDEANFPVDDICDKASDYRRYVLHHVVLE